MPAFAVNQPCNVGYMLCFFGCVRGYSFRMILFISALLNMLYYSCANMLYIRLGKTRRFITIVSQLCIDMLFSVHRSEKTIIDHIGRAFLRNC